MGIPFFGIGAMRAGTTWLADLLRSYPDCAVTPIKELHFFDTRYGVHSAESSYLDKSRNLSQQTSAIQECLKSIFAESRANGHGGPAEGPGGFGDRDPECEAWEGGTYVCWTDDVRRRFHEQSKVTPHIKRLKNMCEFFSIRDLNSYVRYVTRHSRGAAAFGEITPSYALLPAQAYAEMDRVLPGAKFIFVMRDPVDRLWSQVRYAIQRSTQPKRKPNRLFQSATQYPGFFQRSGYRNTITELERVIPAERILYLFFETLVSPESGPSQIRKIEAALGLQFRRTNPRRFQEQMNSSRKDGINFANEQLALDLLAPDYKYISERFGLPPGWRRPDLQHTSETTTHRSRRHQGSGTRSGIRKTCEPVHDPNQPAYAELAKRLGN